MTFLDSGTNDATGDLATETKQDDAITAIEQSKDFFYKVLTGKLTGLSADAFAGNNPDLQDGVEETIWSQGGELNILTTNTSLFVSSTAAGDTSILVLVTGFDDSFNVVSRLATLNGQSQVALNADMMIVDGIQPLGLATGDLYVAEESTGGDLVGGVPQTVSKIQIKMIAGRGAGFNALEVVPAGKTGYLHEISGSISKGNDASIFLKFLPFGLPAFIFAPEFNSFQGTFDFNQVAGNILPEKTIILFSALTSDEGASVTAGGKLVLEDNE